jgi:hypothetical protein
MPDRGGRRQPGYVAIRDASGALKRLRKGTKAATQNKADFGSKRGTRLDEFDGFLHMNIVSPMNETSPVREVLSP